MSLVQAIILGFVQGLTEFLPVSSSGHLILVPKFLGWPDQGLAFDAMIHLGTACAVLFFYRQDAKRLLASLFFKPSDPSIAKLRNVIILGTLPAGIVGLLFKDLIDAHGRNVTLVAINLIVWALIMVSADWFAKKSTRVSSASVPSVPSAFVIGVAQACALLPGTSRSGATIAAGLFSGQSHQNAVRFSFLLGLPIICLASLASLIELTTQSQAVPISGWAMVSGLFAAFIGGIVAIRLLIRLVSSRGLTIFAMYRIALALVILLFLR